MRSFATLPEDQLLATLAWGEARGEGPLGMLAVMWVAKNRSDKQSRALKDVILQPLQFSCFNGGPITERLWDAVKIEPGPWWVALALATLMLGGLTYDPTHGATHYYASSIPPPAWARGPHWTELTEIGHHIFGMCS